VDRARGHHKGRFFELDHVRPHIQPLQKPTRPVGRWHSDEEPPGRPLRDFYPVPPRRPSSRWQSASPSCAPSSCKADKPSARSPLVATCSWRPIGKRHSGVHEGAKGRYIAYAHGASTCYTEDQLEDDFIKTTGSTAILGSPEEVTRHCAGLIERSRSIR